jgi:quercetin dioxygenase-like cupin family protein
MQRRVTRAMVATLRPAVVAVVSIAFVLLAAGFPGGLAEHAMAQPAEPVTVGPVGFSTTTLLQTSTTVVGQPIHFPQGDNQFTAVLGEIAPGGRAGRHMHPVPLMVYMLEGELSIEMEGHEGHVVTAGEAFTEVVNTWHNGRNLGSTPARFLIVFAGQEGTPITIRP